MTIIFRAKTNEAYVIKILVELLTNNIKTGCFEIDTDGISLCMMDHHRKILINLILNSENFSVYQFDSKKMFLGINLTHFHKMIKATKKKDSIELYIDDENPNDLCIKVTPKENSRITISTVKIQTIQNLESRLENLKNNLTQENVDSTKKVLKSKKKIIGVEATKQLKRKLKKIAKKLIIPSVQQNATSDDDSNDDLSDDSNDESTLSSPSMIVRYYKARSRKSSRKIRSKKSPRKANSKKSPRKANSKKSPRKANSKKSPRKRYF